MCPVGTPHDPKFHLTWMDIQIFMYKDVQQTITSNNGNWKQSKYWTIRGVLSDQLKKWKKESKTQRKKWNPS